VLETAHSNRTDRIAGFIGSKNTDLLSKNQGELSGFFDDGQKQWRDAAPYVMLSNAPDQVLEVAPGTRLVRVARQPAAAPDGFVHCR
jgi:hypothetical protein